MRGMRVRNIAAAAVACIAAFAVRGETAISSGDSGGNIVVKSIDETNGGIRLMSYNIHHGRGADKRVDIERIAAAINRERPDFVGLQEVDCGCERSGRIDEPSELARLTGLHPTFASAFPFQGGAYGRAILSREKPIAVNRVRLDGKNPGVLLFCEFSRFWFATMHLDVRSETNRLQQAEIVRAAVLERAKVKPVFLSGDWNAQPGSPVLFRLREFMSVLSCENARTFHAFRKKKPHGEYCIDYIAVDAAHAGDVRVAETYVTENLEASDHNPVVAEVALEANPRPCGAWEVKTVSLGDVRAGFSLTLGGQTGTNGFQTVRACEMAALAVVTNGAVVSATWTGHPACGAGFTVSSQFVLREDGGFDYGGFAYAGSESPLYVRSIAFPEVVAPRTEETAIFRPRYVGEVFHPKWVRYRPGKTVSKSGPVFLAYKCLAALDANGGVSRFFDQRGGSYCASMEVLQGSTAGTLVLRNVYVPPADDGLRRAGRFPFAGVCAPFCGGWYEAAKMHRAWLETQPRFKAAAARDFSKFRAIDLWMWSRGNVEVSEPPVHWFMKETGLKVALDWYWWHGVPYDTCYPFFWPPRDGEAAFRAAVTRMKDAGAFVQVYTNGMLWDCDDGRWDEGGSEGVVVRADGGLRATMFNPFTKQKQARMCGEASVFQNRMRELEKTLASTGMDGVYMDMISCAACEPCYNTSHRHAPGGGTHTTDGYRAFVKAVRDDNPGLLLSSEATSEDYLDLFDSMIVHYSSWERFGFGVMPEHEPVPAVSVIYRGAAALFGSFATPGGIPGWDPLWGTCEDGPNVADIVAKYPDQFAVEFARGVVWGIQPMVRNFVMADVESPRLAADLRFMKDTASFYHGCKEFLFDGEMLPPARLACATRRVAFLETSSYTRPHKSKSCVQEALPCVFHSEWRAKDGRRAVVLVNWTREAQAYVLDFEGARKAGTLPPLSWKIEEL